MKEAYRLADIIIYPRAPEKTQQIELEFTDWETSMFKKQLDRYIDNDSIVFTSNMKSGHVEFFISEFVSLSRCNSFEQLFSKQNPYLPKYEIVINEEIELYSRDRFLLLSSFGFIVDEDINHNSKSSTDEHDDKPAS